MSSRFSERFLGIFNESIGSKMFRKIKIQIGNVRQKLQKLCQFQFANTCWKFNVNTVKHELGFAK